MNKRGVSAVIATVLLVLITIVAAGVIYGAVMPMIKGNIEKSSQCNDAGIEVDQESGYTCYNSATGEVQVSVKRGEKDVQLSGLQIQVAGGGKSKTFEVSGNSSAGIKEYGDNPNVLGIIYLFYYNSGNGIGYYYLQKNTSKTCDIIPSSKITCDNCSYSDACKMAYPTAQSGIFKKENCSFRSWAIYDIECISISIPGKNELITYVINSSGAGIITPEKVAVAPIVKISNKNNVCPLGNPVTISEC